MALDWKIFARRPYIASLSLEEQIRLFQIANEKSIKLREQRYVDFANSNSTSQGAAGDGDTGVTPYVNPYSLNFDGIDDVVELDSSAVFSGVFSLSVWVKPNGFSTSQTIVGAGSSSKNWLRLSSANQITFRINSTTLNFADVGNNLVNNIWQHLLIYRDSSNNVGIFRNGTAFSTTQSTTQNLTLITIGKRGNLEYSGFIDEIAFFSSDQSSNISTIYNGGVPGDLTSLSPLGWWKLNEGTGTTAIDSGTGGNNGTVSSATYSTDVPT